jgi:phosphoenolpyruvate---glycerone phosphotransferase subunit DhaK
VTKKFLNQPAAFVDEMLAGIAAAHPELRLHPEDPRVVLRSTGAARPGHVGILTGGGSGHLPVFLGYVGRGLCSAAAVGNVFSSPSVETIERASRAIDGGAGVLYIYGNYGGDVMNFDEAGELLGHDGVQTATVLVTDDVASAPPDARQRRRGVAGLVFAYKIAGAAAEAGEPLSAVAEIAAHAVRRTNTMGVGLSPCVLPTTGQPTFELGEEEMEIGIGIHGERGVQRGPLRSADAVGRELARRTAEEAVAGAPLAVMLNSLGATSLEELYIVYGSVEDELRRLGLEIERTYVGRYATSLEMAGLSLTLISLDDALRELLGRPAHSPFFCEPGPAVGES